MMFVNQIFGCRTVTFLSYAVVFLLCFPVIFLRLALTPHSIEWQFTPLTVEFGVLSRLSASFVQDSTDA